jgi:hypothetical protein
MSTRDPGIGLALSGGGYRATLFNLGSLWRLNDAGLLPKLARVTSVSGGSITAGVLALAWKDLAFDARGRAGNFGARVAAPLRAFCKQGVDLAAGLEAIATGCSATRHSRTCPPTARGRASSSMPPACRPAPACGSRVLISPITASGAC